MIVVGLTGGIGAGKSTVARILRELGANVIDADQLARQVVERGSETLDRIARTFGADVLDDSGNLLRGRLAERVFVNSAARRELEQITHPAIASAFAAEVSHLERRGVEIVVYDAALLVETGRHRELDCLIVVVADDAQRLERLRARDGLNEEQAHNRLAAQLSQRQKADLADFIIDNSGPLVDTRRQVEEIWHELAHRVARADH
jgi:dephospho-CoA kinase